MTQNIPLGVFAAAGLGGGAAVPAYVQNLVQTNGTKFYTGNTGFSSGYPSRPFLEASAWISLDNTSHEQMLFAWGLDTFLRVNTSGYLDLKIEDDANATVWDFTANTRQLSLDTLYHVYMSFDLANGVGVLLLDGASVTGTGSPSSSSQDIQMNKVFDIFDQIFGGSPKFEGQIGDLWVDNPASLSGYAAFHEGGSPVDLAALAASTLPGIYMGGTMEASDWNANTNLGSITLTGAGTGTFTDVT